MEFMWATYVVLNHTGYKSGLSEMDVSYQQYIDDISTMIKRKASTPIVRCWCFFFQSGKNMLNLNFKVSKIRTLFYCVDQNQINKIVLSFL